MGKMNPQDDADHNCSGQHDLWGVPSIAKLSMTLDLGSNRLGIGKARSGKRGSSLFGPSCAHPRGM